MDTNSLKKFILLALLLPSTGWAVSTITKDVGTATGNLTQSYVVPGNGVSITYGATNAVSFPFTNGIVKFNGTGNLVQAVAGTDYASPTGPFPWSGVTGTPVTYQGYGITNVAPATSGTSILYGNGTGGFSSVTIGSNITFSGGILSATGGGGGSGTVTSVSIAGADSHVTQSGSPITNSGSITVGLNNVAYTDATNTFTAPQNYGSQNLTGSNWRILGSDGSALFATAHFAIDGSGNVTAPSFTGSGSGLTNIGWSVLTGTPTTYQGYGITNIPTALPPNGAAGGDLAGTYPNPTATNGIHLASLPANIAIYPTLNQSTTGTASNVSGVVAVANGGTGTNAPSLIGGTNVTVTGTWPFQTINASGGGSSYTFTAPLTNSAGTVSISNATTNAVGVVRPDGTSITIGAGGIISAVSGGAGTVTSFSSGNLSPIFTTSVANASSTPALSYTLSNAATNAFLAGPVSGSAAAPAYRSIMAADIPALSYLPISGGTMTGAISMGGYNIGGTSWTIDGGGNFYGNILYVGALNSDAGNIVSDGSGNLHITGHVYAETLTGEGIDSSNVPSIDWNNRIAYDNTITICLDWQNRVLYDSAGIYSVDWENRVLYNNNSVPSVDWINGFLINYNGSIAVNWNANTLISNTTGNASVDWDTYILQDADNYISVNWTDRVLYNSGGTAINGIVKIDTADGGWETAQDGVDYVSPGLAAGTYMPLAGGTFTGAVVMGTNIIGGTGWSISGAGVFAGVGSGMTALNASNISSGTVGTARLGSGTASSTTFLRGDQTWQTVGGGGSGTVTNASVVSTNGFAGTVANSTTAPAISISTTVTGLPIGNGTNFTALSATTNSIPVYSGATWTATNAPTISLANAVNGNPIRTVKIQTFTSSGTYTPSAGMAFCEISAYGGGGGGGGAATTTIGFTSGGGGGAASKSITMASAVTIGSSQTVTIGTAGTGGTSGANNGNPGGDTSVGSICIGKGGGGGLGAAVNAGGAGGAGGISGTGTITGTGQGGFTGTGASIQTVGGYSDAGGSTDLGGGGPAPVQTTGISGTGYGSGGSGGNTFSTARAGGNGAPGIVIITEYCTQ